MIYLFSGHRKIRVIFKARILLMKKLGIVLVIFSCFLFISVSIQAQYSPAKQYATDPQQYDTSTKNYRSYHLPSPPAGAPNIVIVMLDDVGFSTAGVFGGMAETPVMDQLANNGLRYTNFHTTGLCAPSRAALLTGRNHHSVNMGHFTETAFDAQGYDAIMPFEKGTMAEVLKENGYNSFLLGK